MGFVEEIIIPRASSGSIRTKQRWTTCTFWITVGVTVQVRVSYACICSELWRLLFACLRTESLRKFWITLLHLSSEFLPLHLPVLLWYSNRMGAHELRHVTVTGLASDSSVQVITRKKKHPSTSLRSEHCCRCLCSCQLHVFQAFATYAGDCHRHTSCYHDQDMQMWWKQPYVSLEPLVYRDRKTCSL